MDLLSRAYQSLPDPTLGGCDDVSGGQQVVSCLLSGEPLAETGESSVAFLQGFGEVGDLLLEVIGPLHVAWTVVAADAHEDSVLRGGELDTGGFEPLLGGCLRFFRNRAVSLRLVQLGSCCPAFSREGGEPFESRLRLFIFGLSRRQLRPEFVLAGLELKGSCLCKEAQSFCQIGQTKAGIGKSRCDAGAVVVEPLDLVCQIIDARAIGTFVDDVHQ
jgi:hypothetical protein